MINLAHAEGHGDSGAAHAIPDDNGEKIGSSCLVLESFATPQRTVRDREMDMRKTLPTKRDGRKRGSRRNAKHDETETPTKQNRHTQRLTCTHTTSTANFSTTHYSSPQTWQEFEPCQTRTTDIVTQSLCADEGNECEEMCSQLSREPTIAGKINRSGAALVKELRQLSGIAKKRYWDETSAKSHAQRELQFCHKKKVQLSTA